MEPCPFLLYSCAELANNVCIKLEEMEYPPNNTIYINNLNEKVKKEGKRAACAMLRA